MCMRNLGQPRDVHDKQSGVARCFCPQKACLGIDIAFPFIQVAWVLNKPCGDAHALRGHVIKHPIGLAKDPVAGDNLVSDFSQKAGQNKDGVHA